MRAKTPADQPLLIHPCPCLAPSLPCRLRDHSNNAHTSRLEWIVIGLILIEVVVGLFECASILGWVGAH